MPSSPIAVTDWRKNRVDPAEATRLAVTLPGIRYSTDKPLLYYPAQILSARGWLVRSCALDLDGLTLAQAGGIATEALQRAVEGLPRVREVLVIAKSVSTLAFEEASRRGFRAVLLTPLLQSSEALVTPHPEGPEPLLAGGTADGFWDEDAARAVSSRVLSFPGANHSLEVPDDWPRSIDILRGTLDALADYAEAPTPS